MATVENLPPPAQNQVPHLETLPDTSHTGSNWSTGEKIAFRFFFLYFVLQALPLDPKYYRHLAAINWLDLHLRDLFNLSRYTPQFLDHQSLPGSFGLATFADWGVAALLALLGTAAWTYRDRGRSHYQQLYYWLRVLLRYRLALGLLAYGFIKLFPLQAPLPSLSNLNTHYGDFEAWKLFSMSLGIVPGYQSFLGLVEISAALLLLNRKTTSIGAFIILAFTGNVVLSNLAYEGGEHVYSLYLVTMALFLFLYDLPRFFSLLTLERPTRPNRFRPLLPGPWPQIRLAGKAAFVFVFVFFYGYKTYAAYRQGPYHYPQSPGLAGAAGLYQVTEYHLNGKALAFSPDDPRRWQDVVFEKWATLSIRFPRPVSPDLVTQEEIYLPDELRTYEASGAGGRHYYGYQVNQGNKVLYLQNKNSRRSSETLTLRFDRPSSSRIILSGRNENRDSIYVVLDKLPKKYLLQEAAGRGRREAFKL